MTSLSTSAAQLPALLHLRLESSERETEVKWAVGGTSPQPSFVLSFYTHLHFFSVVVVLFCFCFFEIGSHYVAQDGLKLTM
jgi:hypothetical protein